jgi:hypothetical protein
MLLDQLASLDTGKEPALPKEVDMLSLIVSGALNGENIAQRYPSFYQRLLESAGLRQAFLDALESVEAERYGELLPIPGGPRTSMDFLRRQPSAAAIEIGEERSWRATWQKTLEQLQAIFSPRELVYRADPADAEDPWFTLLRDEMTADSRTYDVVLDCTLSEETDGALAAFLHLAVTFTEISEPAKFPLHANLTWGEYQESIQVFEEGRARFPDIPLSAIFDDQGAHLRSGLQLVLEMEN